MKKSFSKIDNIVLLAFVVLAFFPWGGLLLSQSGIDITRSVVENITSVASVDAYAIAITVIVSVVSLILVLIKKDKAILNTVAFTAPTVGFVYGMIDTSGDYLSSMELAYIIVVALSIFMLLKKFGVIKLNF